ncbi:hypothetical protein PCE1_002708 [Barthelona sp. PCE]
MNQDSSIQQLVAAAKILKAEVKRLRDVETQLRAEIVSLTEKHDKLEFDKGSEIDQLSRQIEELEKNKEKLLNSITTTQAAHDAEKQNLESRLEIEHEDLQKSYVNTIEELQQKIQELENVDSTINQFPEVEGFLKKRGASERSRFLERYLRLDFIEGVFQVLYYDSYETNMNGKSKGSIAITPTVRCFQVDNSKHDRPYCFEIATDDRTYVLQASSENDARNWVEQLNKVLGNLNK